MSKRLLHKHIENSARVTRKERMSIRKASRSFATSKNIGIGLSRDSPESDSRKSETKIIQLLPLLQSAPDLFTDRMPLAKLKALWGQKASAYTEHQLYKIREFAYTLCEVVYKIINRRQAKIIELNHEPDTERAQSDTLRSGEYRRAS